MAAIRFLEGVSWRYSPMLIHDKLEKKHWRELIVNFNLLQRAE
jgi:hypothetical protein